VLCTYTGTDTRMYPDYADASTGRALEPLPGGVYDVRVAPGRNPGLPLPPGDGRWAPVPDDAEQIADLIADAEAAGAAPDAEPEPDPEPAGAPEEPAELPAEPPEPDTEPAEPQTPPEPAQDPGAPGNDDQAAPEAAPEPEGVG
jgi:hypothetical protein